MTPHCKLCMARNECDVPGCPLAFLADGRRPRTTSETDLAELLSREIKRHEATEENNQSSSGGVPYITWYDRPDENERHYNHYGCDGRGARWFFPLDDCREPTDGETEECVNCCEVLPLKHDALHQEG